LLYLNDTSLEEPTYRHVKTAFDNNPSIKSVIVVCPNKTITEDVLNDKHNLNLMEPKLLSSITTVSTRTSTSGIIRTMIFKYGDDKFGRSSISAFEQDTKPKVIVNTNKSGNGRELRHDKLNFYTLKSLLNYAKDVSFYGVDSKVDVDKILKKYPTTKSFEAFLNDRIINSNREDYVKMLAMNASSSSSSDIRYLYPVCKFISDKSSLFVKTLEANNLVSYDRVAADKASIYQQLTSPITEKEIADYLANHPEIDVDNMKEAFKNKYPMLMIIRSYYIEDCAKGIADYINLIDKN
jgi:hypothetical protein